MESLKPKSHWNTHDIQAAVDSYLRMLELEQQGEKINKALENRILRKHLSEDRTESSIEFRMQNISAVLDELGKTWIKGYRPAKNVGANVKTKIKNALTSSSIPTNEDYVPTSDDDILEERSRKLEKKHIIDVPEGILAPKETYTSTKKYLRSPEVRAWVRRHARGICEGCEQKAPFNVEGQPFLEVHHVKRLAEGGSDTISNAVALCPNCHRRAHYSSDKKDFTNTLYIKVTRLAKES